MIFLELSADAVLQPVHPDTAFVLSFARKDIPPFDYVTLAEVRVYQQQVPVPHADVTNRELQLTLQVLGQER